MTSVPRPTNPRLAPVTEPDPAVAETLAKTLWRDGKPFNVFATLAHHPRILKRFNALGGAYLAHGTLPARERELVILRVGARSGSVYEFGQHTLIGRDCGVTGDEIEALALADRVGRHDWSPGDRTLLRMVDELCDDDCVSEATWVELARRYDPAQLVELLTMTGFYRMLAGFLNTVGVEPDPGVPGWPAAPSGEDRAWTSA